MPSSCLQVWVVLEMNQIGCTRVDKVYNQHTDAITNGLIYPNNICQEQKIGRYTMDLILIIAVIAFIYLWKKKKDEPYDNAVLRSVKYADVILKMSNGKRFQEGLEVDHGSNYTMPGTRKPCLVLMMVTDYLEKWLRQEHNTSLSGVESSSLRLRSNDGWLDMSQFTWVCEYDSSNSAIWVYIRER